MAMRILGRYRTSAPVLVNGEDCDIQLDASGYLMVSPPVLAAGSSRIGNVIVDQEPALAPTTDAPAVVHATNYMAVASDGTNAGTLLTPKFASISRASNADGAAVVSIVSSKKIRVVSCYFVCLTAVGAKFQSSTSDSTGAGVNTDLTGLASYAANGGMVLPFNPTGWFQTAAGESLKLLLNGAVQVSGCLTYVEV